MTLSILIVNWNSKDHIRRCLETIRDTCTEISPQVVVVDGGILWQCWPFVPDCADRPKLWMALTCVRLLGKQENTPKVLS